MPGFSAPTQAWFTSAFGSPTLVQEQAWAAIAQREDVLVVAPTGSGKTLAAFLWAIDQFGRSSAANRLPRVDRSERAPAGHA